MADTDNPNQPWLMTVPEAARYLRLAESTLNKMRCKEGGPPFATVGDRLIRYPEPEAKRWLYARLRHSTRQKLPR
ncbi:helix-turn-helix transcriptional regulator [Mesorhizobium sp. B261B1A]|uniref:helix-turn-helix transcriptional regulator n=1 Tax=Mesorhizobium sp. B261B1A TaxID=2876671 RepID=UPI001CD14AF2|nr:helix-turn-helix domain-containing protein [Mesorhizobium sp. B261B1A]MCA0058055.1 helix-turn-helix domain-containing protein [Mesorhizobium sp. B261B1A]